ncbi:hypothetical protein A7A78_11645 [Aequorivita soesokkakensis]|uniref:Uncharacterized protein n=1 Tax=Aequorivita soesokkakensis TaxID=1385699 RepID=A0A1A9LEI6_9FLAO|nr:hypothetical protein [Aequorivita soesokkakensis]OAD91680.1 hypothetical protein A7A78_11645 [Aequorivita soesokkakensis]
MNKIIILIFLLFSAFIHGQIENKDFDNLVKLGEIYSKNVNATGDEFKNSVEKLRTPNLNHIIDALIAVGEEDEKLLTKEFLSKPSDLELKYWYVIREIHYNRVSKEKQPRPNKIVAEEVLESEIDERWLLANYYYRIQGGIAKVFNDADLSDYNFNINDYGLKNETEKAILYFSLTGAMTQRFMVLQVLKKPEKLLEFADKLPAFNGKPYYEYTSFDFEDFDWVGYDKTESYKKVHIGNVYQSINAYFSAIADKKDTEKARDIYFKSILYIPKYFKYSGLMESDLNEIYKKSKE